MALDTTVGGASTDSYVTTAEWETYVDNYVNGSLGGHGHESDHEQNLRRAFQILNNKSWIGIKQYQTQTGAWPRITNKLIDGWPINVDTIPQDIKDAQCELAYLIHEGLDPYATVTTGAVKASRSKAGPVETETEYATSRETPRIVAIEGFIGPYLKAGSSQVSLGRG